MVGYRHNWVDLDGLRPVFAIVVFAMSCEYSLGVPDTPGIESIACQPDNGRIEVGGTVRPVEDGITETEDAAVSCDQPVATTTWGRSLLSDSSRARATLISLRLLALVPKGAGRRRRCL